MSLRRIGWAIACGAVIVASGWVASALPYGPAGAWAALTLFPGWFVYTVISQHPFSESLDLTGRLAVTLGSWLFWAVPSAAVILIRARTWRVHRQP